MAQYAIIHVRPEPNTDAWPIVERTRGGWQSGVHHYPDAEVLDVRPLARLDPDEVSEQDIPLRRVEFWVCDLCLDGAGGECHVPGCNFWINDAPSGLELEWIRARAAY